MPDESNDNTTYTAADIERYLSGKMPPQEMHRLERDALDDPFLADAIEGYAYTQSPAQDAGALKSELEKKIRPAKVVAIGKSFNSRLWKAAALIILVAGAGIAIYQYGFAPSSNEMALQKSGPAGQSNEAEAPVQYHVADSASDAVVFESKQEEIPAAAPAPENQKRSIRSPLPGKKVQSIKEGRVAVAKPDTVAENTGLVQGNEAAGATAGIRVAESKAPSAAPPPSTDDSGSVVVGFARTKRKAELNAMQKDVRQQDSSVNEIVLSEQKATASHKPIVTFEEVEPVQGTSYLDEYIADNLKTPEDLKVKSGPGEIALSFDVDEKGQAVNIKVEKSLCEVCDKEAVRVIKEGPKWIKKKKNKKGKISFRFE